MSHRIYFCLRICIILHTPFYPFKILQEVFRTMDNKYDASYNKSDFVYKYLFGYTVSIEEARGNVCIGQMHFIAA